MNSTTFLNCALTCENVINQTTISLELFTCENIINELIKRILCFNDVKGYDQLSFFQSFRNVHAIKTFIFCQLTVTMNTANIK